ncbi:diaminobutyrate--2-oxoglutarate transaminase [Cysteiniphilum sp. 19S12-1]|uniref:diaminobutyrate--2-oxoglutarate transaminase n=1 Tax=Cysteiniphilum sp. 19S12-1 TaxID=3453130 RepID=UPI003F8763A5
MVKYSSDQYESNVRSYCRDYHVLFKKARNDILEANDGKKYVDFLSGAGTLNYGHNHPLLKNVLINYLKKDGIIHGLDFITNAKENFIEIFQNKILEPRDLKYKLQFTGPTGANSVEAALKLARKFTNRSNIVCFTNAFHGMSMGALSVTGSISRRESISTLANGVIRLPFENYKNLNIDTITLLQNMLDDPSSGVELPAAIIIETIQGEGGVNIASKEWLENLCCLCRNKGILIIFDEIQIGCGRTSKFFSFEGYNLVPDMICVSKSLSGFGFPMSLLLINPDIDIWSPGEHNGTFRGHNAAFVTSAAAINQFWSDDLFQQEIQMKSSIIDTFLKRISFLEIIAGIRIKGMIAGIELLSQYLAEKIKSLAFDSKLIIETCGPSGEVLKLLPPLTITYENLNYGLDLLEKLLTETNNEFKNKSL